MLCRRSASLIRITRRSRDIASSILRKLSAAASWRSRNCSLSSLVTPSTRSATVSPNSAGQRLAGQRRVFEGVVQDRRDQRLDVQPLVGQHLGHGDRMGDVGLARLARLPGVRRGADRPGAAQQFALRLGQVVRRLVPVRARSPAAPRRRQGRATQPARQGLTASSEGTSCSQSTRAGAARRNVGVALASARKSNGPAEAGPCQAIATRISAIDWPQRVSRRPWTGRRRPRLRPRPTPSPRAPCARARPSRPRR